ncbi:S26 family signal peptidase [Micromonospora sp. NPDC006431]|uniref:S26 family signal peptidase n=1 Tax=Micromonospora sp. NPDC006431 TaxID=3364235 RepID=UPI00369D21B0
MRRSTRVVPARAVAQPATTAATDQPSPSRSAPRPRSPPARRGRPIPRDVAALQCAPGIRVPYGRVVVLGDNPGRSLDSRLSGYVTTDRLLGVVLRRLR